MTNQELIQKTKKELDEWMEGQDSLVPSDSL
jgi:hypothetical protein